MAFVKMKKFKFGDKVNMGGNNFTVIEDKPRSIKVRRTIKNPSGSVTLSPNLISIKKKKSLIKNM